jgi:hypothetical protein
MGSSSDQLPNLSQLPSRQTTSFFLSKGALTLNTLVKILSGLALLFDRVGLSNTL